MYRIIIFLANRPWIFILIDLQFYSKVNTLKVMLSWTVKLFNFWTCLVLQAVNQYEGPAKFCHWVQITSVLRFIKHIFITKLFQSIPPLMKHIFVTFLPSCEKQLNSLLLVSVGDTDK